MQSDKPHREWWISDIANASWTGVQFQKLTKLPQMVDKLGGFTHVVEYAALDQALLRIKELTEALDWSIKHLESMEKYSIVEGAIYRMKEALKDTKE